MRRVAIVGGGIAGLGLAYYLRGNCELTLFEREGRLGGHANTVEVIENGRSLPVDTGFMVFNHATYPNLLRLFNELEVETKKTDMSFSVQHCEQNLEYAGASFDRLFSDRKNLVNLPFWKLLVEINRFNTEANEAVNESRWHELSLNDYASVRGYSDNFVRCYLIPMSAAIWSTPPEKMLQFPAVTLLRFFKNHGLLGVSSQHQWWTVEGGSKQYVEKLVDALDGAVRVRSNVVEVRRQSCGVQVITRDGCPAHFDQVVFACHANEVLEILCEPRELERTLLGAFSYQANNTILHTDPSIMPREKRCWASWNYRLDRRGASTHYWMNNLQNVSKEQNYFVTLNGDHLVDERRVLRRMVYHHPVFNLEAIRAQQKLHLLNENSYQDQVFFCGSYFGYGFHEDALLSSKRLAEVLTTRALCH